MRMKADRLIASPFPGRLQPREARGREGYMSTPLSVTAARLTRRRNGVKQERISGGAFLPRQAPPLIAIRLTTRDDLGGSRQRGLGSRIVNPALAPSTLKK